MGKFSTSYQLVKMAFKVINKEKELLVYSILSVISFLVVIFSFFMFVVGLSFTGLTSVENEAASGAIDIVLMFLFYFILTFVALFFNAAIITSVNRSINGKENSFGDGIKSAFEHIGKIFIWALISAFVSTIIKAIQDRVPGLAKLIVGLVGAVWNIATYFAFPLMLIDNKKAGEAIKESPMMFKKGWGETVIVNVGTGFFFGALISLLIVVSLLLGYISMTAGSAALGIITAVVFVVGLGFLLLLSSTTDSVLKTLLYIYIQKESVPEFIDTNLLGEMFKEK